VENRQQLTSQFIANVFVFWKHQERLLHETGLQWPELQEMLWQEETDVTEKSKRNHKKQVRVYFSSWQMNRNH